MNLSDVVETEDRIVKVCGVPFKLGEFNMRTRALWLDVLDDYDLPEKQKKLQTEILPEVATSAQVIEQDPHVQSLNKRFIKLQKKHENLLEVYGGDDEPDDIDEQITRVVERMSELSEEIDRVGIPKAREAVDLTKEGQKFLEEFMVLQDEARLKFAWNLATASGKTDDTFEEFQAKARPDDYDAVEEWVMLGNAGWVARLQNRQGRRATQKTQIGTSFTAKRSQQESPQNDSPN